MMAAQVSKREKILGLITGGCIAVIVAGQIGWDCVHHGFEALDHEIASLNDSVRKNQILLSRQGRVEGQFLQAARLLEEQNVKEDRMTEFLAAINATAQAKKIQLQELNSLPLEKDQDLRTFKIKVSLAGSWPDMLEFFNELQKLPHRFDIEDVVLEKSAAGEHLVRCQMTLSRWVLEEDPE
jgi:Tfp pilus assembly protein PilO